MCSYFIHEIKKILKWKLKEELKKKNQTVYT